MIIDKLQNFRQQIYGFLGNGRDAIFDLMDAVLTSPNVKSQNYQYQQCIDANGQACMNC